MTSQKPPHIFITVPAFGSSMSSYTALSLMELTRVLTLNGIPICHCSVSYPDIADLRGFFATMFLDGTECSHWLSVDADMGFPVELVRDMLGLNEPVTGCLYRQKSETGTFVMNGRPNPQEAKGGFLRVDGVGGGVLLIRRDAVTAMVDKHPELVDTRIEKLGIYGNLKQYNLNRLLRLFDIMDLPAGRLSEDYSFCRRWTDMGGKIWASTDHEISHFGLKDFAGTFSKMVGMEKLEAAE